MSDKLRVMFYQDNGVWLAQGLEHDICVQADSLDELYGRFEVAACMERDENNDLGHLPEAPACFFRMWDRKSGEYTPSFGDTNRYEVGLAA